MLNVRDKAPDFQVARTRGKTRRLSDYRGKNVVSWSIREADTPRRPREGWGSEGVTLCDAAQKANAEISLRVVRQRRGTMTLRGEVGYPFPRSATPTCMGYRRLRRGRWPPPRRRLKTTREDRAGLRTPRPGEVVKTLPRRRTSWPSHEELFRERRGRVSAPSRPFGAALPIRPRLRARPPVPSAPAAMRPSSPSVTEVSHARDVDATTGTPDAIASRMARCPCSEPDAGKRRRSHDR